MKRQKTSWLKRLSASRKNAAIQRYHGGSSGFTLVELIVAAMITTIAILIVGAGFISVLNSGKMAEARTARRTELNRAFDFITNEVRQAQSINQTANIVANATTTVADIVVQSGLSLSSLGSYGTPALYMEIPIGKAPALCPAGGPNAGLAPPFPTSYDRVVYDIRTSSQGWLGPRAISRYGRIPKSDGSIDPCSNPIASDVLIDAISPTMSVLPTCPTPSVLSGAEGFYTCVNGAQVDLFFQSNVVGAETRKLVSAASSRIVNLNLPQLALEAIPPQVGDTVNLQWSWPDAASDTIYDLYQVVGLSTTKLYSGSNLSTSATLTGSTGENNCFVLKTSIPPATVAESNQVCFLKS
jgi:type II secretory pathway pseudopilin PulG